MHGEASGRILLTVILQSNKNGNVRPVMNYSYELNKHVTSNPGNNVIVCQEKPREWRTFSDQMCILDLQKTYFQVLVDVSLQQFQAVHFNGRLYVMTCMGFGLSTKIRPKSKIIYHVTAKVLYLDDSVWSGCDHNIDDIVNEKIVPLSQLWPNGGSRSGSL